MGNDDLKLSELEVTSVKRTVTEKADGSETETMSYSLEGDNVKLTITTERSLLLLPGKEFDVVFKAPQSSLEDFGEEAQPRTCPKCEIPLELTEAKRIVAKIKDEEEPVLYQTPFLICDDCDFEFAVSLPDGAYQWKLAEEQPAGVGPSPDPDSAEQGDFLLLADDFLGDDFGDLCGGLVQDVRIEKNMKENFLYATAQLVNEPTKKEIRQVRERLEELTGYPWNHIDNRTFAANKDALNKITEDTPEEHKPKKNASEHLDDFAKGKIAFLHAHPRTSNILNEPTTSSAFQNDLQRLTDEELEFCLKHETRKGARKLLEKRMEK